MILRCVHTPMRRSGLVGLLLLLGVAGPTLSAPCAEAGSRLPARALTGSRYPAGATRPAIPARRSQFARRASSRPASKASRPTHRRAARKKARKPLLQGNAARALVAFRAMQRHFYVQGANLYEGEPFSYLWPFSQALAATVSLMNVPGMPAAFARETHTSLASEIHTRLVGLRSYLDTTNSGAPEGTFTSTLAAFDGSVAPPAGPGGAKYYDDNDWVGIELMRLYEHTHNAATLGSAEAIMAFEMAGWQAD